jgi:hypothetical protein
MKCKDSNALTCSLKASATLCTLGYYPINGVCVACSSATDACVPAC